MQVPVTHRETCVNASLYTLHLSMQYSKTPPLKAFFSHQLHGALPLKATWWLSAFPKHLPEALEILF